MDNLNESKIEDDDMVEIVFQFTNFADDNQRSFGAGTPSVTSMSIAQKSQHSNVTTSAQKYQTDSHEKVAVSFAKTPTKFEETRSSQNESDGQMQRSRKKKHRSKSDLGLFKNMFNKPNQSVNDYRSSGDGAEKPDSSTIEGDKEAHDPKKCFVHYDSRSILADYNPTSVGCSSNSYGHITSGAAAVQPHDINYSEAPADSLLLETPNFINETFTDASTKSTPGTSLLKTCPKHQIVLFEGVAGSESVVSNRDKLLHGISMLDHTVDRRFLCFEHMDHGSNYYRRYFADYGNLLRTTVMIMLSYSFKFHTIDPFQELCLRTQVQLRITYQTLAVIIPIKFLFKH